MVAIRKVKVEILRSCVINGEPQKEGDIKEIFAHKMREFAGRGLLKVIEDEKAVIEPESHEQEDNSAPETNLSDEEKMHRVLEEITKMVPGNEAQWTQGGKPDANYLKDVCNFAVTGKMRDDAWDLLSKQTEPDNVSTVPAGTDIASLAADGSKKAAVKG